MRHRLFNTSFLARSSVPHSLTHYIGHHTPASWFASAGCFDFYFFCPEQKNIILKDMCFAGEVEGNGVEVEQEGGGVS